ncbi:MAG: glycosyltransferase family 4 protein [Planctomycetota bacterium]|jgi:glycosyltransferase involved in cell wall biosynthesis
MKVAVIIERYDISLGGAEWLAYELASALSELGAEVDILAAYGDNTAPHARILCQTSNGKRISLASFSKLMSEHIDQENYDIIHSLIPLTVADVYQPPGGSFAEAVIRNAASYRNKLVTWYKKATAFTNWHRSEMLLAERRICRDANGPIIAALSNYVKEQFISHYGIDEDRLALIPNGVKVDNRIDLEITKKLKSQIMEQPEIKSSPNPVYFLFGANNFRLKGLDVMMEALAILNQSQMPGEPYLIVAGGGKINKYKSIARKLKVDGKVVFLGHLPNIQNALSISDVAVLPTFYDPCSRYILEALAACKPVITSKFNGAADFFEDGRHGIVTKHPENARELAEAVKHFTDANNRTRASKAIEEDKLKDNITISRAAKQLVSLYEKIIERKGKI